MKDTATNRAFVLDGSDDGLDYLWRGFSRIQIDATPISADDDSQVGSFDDEFILLVECNKQFSINIGGSAAQKHTHSCFYTGEEYPPAKTIDRAYNFETHIVNKTFTEVCGELKDNKAAFVRGSVGSVNL